LVVAQVPLLLKPMQARVVGVQLKRLVKEVRSQALERVDHRQQLQEMRRV
jgi:hypothetical protein